MRSAFEAFHARFERTRHARLRARRLASDMVLSRVRTLCMSDRGRGRGLEVSIRAIPAWFMCQFTLGCINSPGGPSAHLEGMICLSGRFAACRGRSCSSHQGSGSPACLLFENTGAQHILSVEGGLSSCESSAGPCAHASTSDRGSRRSCSIGSGPTAGRTRREDRE